jgi:hypothetical protein
MPTIRVIDSKRSKPLIQRENRLLVVSNPAQPTTLQFQLVRGRASMTLRLVPRKPAQPVTGVTNAA